MTLSVIIKILKILYRSRRHSHADVATHTQKTYFTNKTMNNILLDLLCLPFVPGILFLSIKIQTFGPGGSNSLSQGATWVVT